MSNVARAQRNPKLMRPSPGPWTMPRDRLHRLLGIAGSFPIALVTAPAGYGKTTSLSLWATGQPRAVCWISLDDGDRSWPALLLTLVDALRSVGIDAGRALMSPDGRGEALQLEWAVDCLVDDLATSSHPLTIVLDDAHVLASPLAQRFAGRLLGSLPANVHLIVSARSMPAFLEGATTKPGRVFQIDADELRFTSDEAERFLASIVPDELDEATRRTVIETADGWIVGLHAAGLGLLKTRGTDARGVPAIRPAATSLMGEVVDRLPLDLQRTLHRLSVPSRLCPELVCRLMPEAMTPAEAHQLLQELVGAGLFLASLGDDADWYRFHPLFRELLRERLARSMSETETRALHRVASEWFAAYGEMAEALDHARAAGEIALVFPELVRASHRMLADDRWFEAEAWLARVPAELIEQDIELLLIAAWVCQTRGRHGLLRQRIQQARFVLSNTPLSARSERLRQIYEAELDVLTVMADEGSLPFDEVCRISAGADLVLRGSGRYAELLAMFGHLIYWGTIHPDEAIAAAEEIAQRAQSSGQRFPQLARLWALSARALVLGRDSDVHTLEHSARSVLDGARRVHAPRLEAQGAFYLGAMLYEQDRLTEAAQLLRSAARSSAAGILVRLGATIRLAQCLAALGEEQDADLELESLRDWLIEIDATDFLSVLRASQARLALMNGNLSLARSVMNAVPLELQRPRIRTLETPAVTMALVHILVGTEHDLHAADQLLTELEQNSLSLHWRSNLLQLRLVRALFERVQGQDERARSLIHDVATEAERTGYLRSVLDLGPAIAEMLCWSLQTYPYAAAIQRLVIAFRPSGSPFVVSDVVSERLNGANGDIPRGERASPARGQTTLSEREMDVLRGFQGRWTDKEIAAALSISPLTVKSHAQNIYAKLDVHSRRQAVRQALDLGLLQDSS